MMNDEFHEWIKSVAIEIACELSCTIDGGTGSSPAQQRMYAIYQELRTTEPAAALIARATWVAERIAAALDGGEA